MVQGLLPSFHSTFMPERRYLSEILKLGMQETGPLQVADISEMTGIPTGQSSGKVEPAIRYAQGMGLIAATREAGAGFALSATPLGRQVWQEDRFISEELSQILLHVMLCRARGGAEVWHALFADGWLALGAAFTSEKMQQYLTDRFGKSSSVPGPVLRMYADSSSFAAAAALVEQGQTIQRRILPTISSFYPAYVAALMLIWDQVFPEAQQVALADLEAATGFLAVLGWQAQEQTDFMSWLAHTGLAKTDRQTGSPLVTRLCETTQAIERIYDGLA